ncbi:leucine-rich repeat-containing protein 57 [Chironomus tepperi]|uniref:leucine-rich repeat-containing protein 57 n=1 Tax=Chironomus tepperi TaxID=113505 RepID=UPI00391F9499
MGNSAVKQHFETAQRTGVLKISQKRLKDFPPQLREFPNVLRTLDLSENHYVTIPELIGKFTLLKHLNISSNKLVALPEAIGGCTKLETLNAMNNVITAVPMCYANLKNLKTVNLSNNQITEFPVMFSGLTHLDMLDLSRNKIVSIPSAAKDLYCTELNLNQNQISSIAEELAQCQKLKTLRLEENCLQITSIPTKILSNSVISNITIDGNLFNNKQFTELEGYKIYEERFTAVKKKMF